ncbi:MAG: Asp-tRNA(Asn)/Glu-tRNA(Gln) amidotransferase GatCAB subunit B, partial [Oscillospiraceae bacterium]|nr:Asp-tRNA(Asn)/Glu-tRNA(Gln) amidotransferase GatCAB subunit B [Oscillospiraceae bacterium]
LEVIDKVIASNEKAVGQYVGGDVKVFGFLMGQCSKALRGAATPKVIKEELEKKLKSLCD